MIRGSTREEDITIVIVFVLNIGTNQYMRQMLTAIKGEIDNKAIIVGDFNTPTVTNGQINQIENQ